MQTKSNINWKKLLQGVSLAAFAAAPVFGATGISQAAPPDHAPAYGYRNHDNRNDDNDSDDDNDHGDGTWNNRDRNNDNRDNRNDYNRNDYNRNDDIISNSTRSLSGVVVNDLRGRDFVLRLNNGRTVRVQLDEREPRRLSQGDRVQVQGSFYQTNRTNNSNTRYNDNLVFRATSIRVIRDRNSGNNNNSRRTLNGIVTSVRSDQSFTFTAMNRSFNVSPITRLPRGFSRGDIISVSGDVRDNNISNAKVTMVRNGTGTNGNYGYGNNGNYDNGNYSNGNYNNGNYNNGNYNNGTYNNSTSKSVNFPATVLDSNVRTGTLQVRGEDGRQYTVRTKEADNWKRGDNVRIKGQSQNGIVTADDIDKR